MRHANHDKRRPKTALAKTPSQGQGALEILDLWAFSQCHGSAVTNARPASPSSSPNTVAGNVAPYPQYLASQTRCKPNR